jgi:hypothetical protein
MNGEARIFNLNVQVTVVLNGFPPSRDYHVASGRKHPQHRYEQERNTEKQKSFWHAYLPFEDLTYHYLRIKKRGIRDAPAWGSVDTLKASSGKY